MGKETTSVVKRFWIPELLELMGYKLWIIFSVFENSIWMTLRINKGGWILVFSALLLLCYNLTSS